jgi:hypothetical protein
MWQCYGTALQVWLTAFALCPMLCWAAGTLPLLLSLLQWSTSPLNLPCCVRLQWLAVNTVDFYNAISVLYGTLAEFCTERNCEVMSAGSKVCIPQLLGADINSTTAKWWQELLSC